MSKYFSGFQIVGEIADMLLLREPDRRLLVDISLDAPGHEKTSFKRHPTRTTFTIFDLHLIDRFMSTAATGDVVEATGSFSQSDYIPHRTSYIDTTFTLKDFKILEKTAVPHDPTTRNDEGDRV